MTRVEERGFVALAHKSPSFAQGARKGWGTLKHCGDCRLVGQAPAVAAERAASTSMSLPEVTS